MKMHQKWPMTLISAPRSGKTLCRRRRRLQNALATLPRCFQHADCMQQIQFLCKLLPRSMRLFKLSPPLFKLAPPLCKLSPQFCPEKRARKCNKLHRGAMNEQVPIVTYLPREIHVFCVERSQKLWSLHVFILRIIVVRCGAWRSNA